MSFPSFAEYFKAATGHDPFPWQSALAAKAVTGDWPQAIHVPTGLGKTSAIHAAIYAAAWQAHHSPANRTTPQRIVHVVNRRSVVDQTFSALSAALREDSLAPVSQALRSLAGPWARGGGADECPVEIARIHGEAEDLRGWLRPTGVCVVTMTPHQLVSRLGFRGFGVSSRTRSIHAGLLGVDTLILFDEPHLSPQACSSVRQLLGMQGSASEKLGIPASQLVLLGATLTDQAEVSDIHTVTDEDLKTATVVPAFHTPRKLHLLREDQSDDKVASAMAKAYAAERRTRGYRARLAIIANSVATAQAIHSILRESEPDVVLLTSRMRPFDRQQAQTLVHPGDDSATTVVATQCLEVGVDLSFDALITEACPWPSLIQRVGRVNRDGRATDPKIVLVTGKSPGRVRSATQAVYGLEPVRATTEFLTTLADSEGVVDLSPSAQRQIEAPAKSWPAQPRIATLHRDYVDVMAITFPTPWSDYPIERFIVGPDEKPSLDVQVAWRADLGTVEDCPPTSAEFVSVPLPAFRALLSDGSSLDFGDVEALPGTQLTIPTPVRDEQDVLVRRDDVWVRLAPRELRPGDVVVLPSSVGGYTTAQGWFPKSREPVADLSLVAAIAATHRDASTPARVAAHRAQTWFPVTTATLMPWLERHGAPEPPQNHPFLRCLDELGQALDIHSEDEIRDRLAEVAPSGLLVEQWRLSVVTPSRSHPRLIAHVEHRTAMAKSFEQDLEKHQQQVAAVAAEAATAMGLDKDLGWRLAQAARWHDVGKAKESFQRYMGRCEGAPALGKSRRGRSNPATERRIAEAMDHELGWRHEGASAHLVQASVDDDLVVHLIGSHHGRFRPFLNSHSEQADQRELPQRARAFHRLNEQFGPWGLAYLEALVRLSDWHASSEPTFPAVEDVVGKLPPPISPPASVPVSAVGTELLGLRSTPLTGWFAAAGLLRCTHELGIDARVWWPRRGSRGPTVPMWRSHLSPEDCARAVIDSPRWQELVNDSARLQDKGLAKKYQTVGPAELLSQVLNSSPPGSITRGLLQDSAAAQKSLIALAMPASANNASYVETALAQLKRPSPVAALVNALQDPLAGWEEGKCDGGMDRPGIDDGVSGREIKDHRLIRTALAPAAVLGMAALGPAGLQGIGVGRLNRRQTLILPLPDEPASWDDLRALTHAGLTASEWVLRYTRETFSYEKLWFGHPVRACDLK